MLTPGIFKYLHILEEYHLLYPGVFQDVFAQYRCAVCRRPVGGGYESKLAALLKFRKPQDDEKVKIIHLPLIEFSPIGESLQSCPEEFFVSLFSNVRRIGTTVGEFPIKAPLYLVKNHLFLAFQG